MGHRALDIVARETQVEFAVTSYGEFLYHFVGLKALAPKFHDFSVYVWG